MKKWPKTAVFGERVKGFKRGTRFTVNDSLYSRPIFPLSNDAYGVSLRPSVVEQSAQDRSGVALFFDPVNFPGSMLNLSVLRLPATAWGIVPDPPPPLFS